MAAGQQVWLVVALFSIVGVDPCRAFGDPQVIYNRNGISGLEGTWSWQTPEGSSVWIQYPVNQQGVIPWNPAEFSYSISSYPASNVISFDERIHSNFLDVNHASNPSHTFRSGRELDLQNPNNNHENSFFLVKNQKNDQNEIKIEDEMIQNPPGPLINTFSGPAMDTFQVPVIEKFPVQQMAKFPLSEINTFPDPVRDTFSGPVMDKFLDPGMDKFPSLLEIPTESPVEFNTVQFMENVSPKVLPTESDFKNNVNNKIDDFNSVNRDEHVEDLTDLVPVVRLTSRGRPQRLKLTTRKPSIARNRVNRPVPRLLQDTSNRQRNIRLTSRGRTQLFR